MIGQQARLAERFDVIVVGGGFTGCAAALASAREGMKVLLIEQGGSLGGAATQCLVNPLMPWKTTVEKDGVQTELPLSQGIFTEILDRLEAADGARLPHFHEEYLKLVLDRMLEEAGVSVLFHTMVHGVRIEGARLTAITDSNVGGTFDFAAEAFIDCTGDASVAARCGCPFRIGREADSLCQPMTLCFRLVNVDTARMNRAEISRLYQIAQKEGRIQNPREDVLTFDTLVPGMVHFNSTRVVRLDPTDGFDVSRAERIAREQMFELFGFLRGAVPAFAGAKLATSASHIGVRESRMIDGEYLLTEQDLKACTRFPDAIAAGNYDIDIHNPEGSGTSHYYFEPGAYYTIPYRSMVPQGADNLLVSGRCISATHEAQASIRIMPIVCTLGEAAGVAAAVANAAKCAMKDVDVRRVQEILVRNGAFIG